MSLDMIDMMVTLLITLKLANADDGHSPRSRYGTVRRRIPASFETGLGERRGNTIRACMVRCPASPLKSVFQSLSDAGSMPGSKARYSTWKLTNPGVATTSSARRKYSGSSTVVIVQGLMATGRKPWWTDEPEGGDERLPLSLAEPLAAGSQEPRALAPVPVLAAEAEAGRVVQDPGLVDDLEHERRALGAVEARRGTAART